MSRAVWNLGARVVLAFAIASVAACDRRFEPYVPPEEEPPRVEGPVRIPGLESPSPRTRMAAAPAGAGEVRGTVRLAGGAAPPEGGVLFVIARSGQAGPPLAVRRLPPGPFPIPFELGPADAMIPGRALSGSILLTARLDSDGDPMTRQEGDLETDGPARAEVGASGVELVLR